MTLEFIAALTFFAVQGRSSQFSMYSAVDKLSIYTTASNRVREADLGDEESAETQEPVPIDVGSDDDPMMAVAREIRGIAAELGKSNEVLKNQESAIQAQLTGVRQKFSGALMKVVVWSNGKLRYPECGAKFRVYCRSREVVPGTCGRVEIEIGAVVRDQVPICVRACDGEVLVGMTITKRADIIPFEFGEADYQISLVSTWDIPTWDGSTYGGTEFLVKQLPKAENSHPKLMSGQPAEAPQSMPSQLDLGALVGFAQLGPEDGGLSTPCLARALEYVVQSGNKLILRIDQLTQALKVNPKLDCATELRDIESGIDSIGVAVKSLCERQYRNAEEPCSTADMTLLRVKPMDYVPSSLADIERPFDCVEVIRRGRRFKSATIYAMRFPARLDDQFKAGAIVNIQAPFSAPWASTPFELKTGIEYLVAVAPPRPQKLAFFPVDGRGGRRNIVFAFRLN